MSARLTLRHGGKVFLDRWGFECRWFGVFVHRITDADPGKDLHDHPWPFVSIVLRGGYTEEVAPGREATSLGQITVDWRTWAAGSIHRFRLTEAHRIIDVRPGTWTLVARGRKSRPWGFYQPGEWVNFRDYDYATRRPVTVEEGAR